jgi:hypothetical protein
VAELDGSACPRSNGRVGRDDQQHRRAGKLRPQGGHVGGPGQQLVALDLALDLDDHAGHRPIREVVQNDHGIRAILGRRDLG